MTTSCLQLRLKKLVVRRDFAASQLQLWAFPKARVQEAREIKIQQPKEEAKKIISNSQKKPKGQMSST